MQTDLNRTHTTHAIFMLASAVQSVSSMAEHVSDDSAAQWKEHALDAIQKATIALAKTSY